MARLHQAILIVSTLLVSWLGMQAIHELGHFLGARASGGAVRLVVLNPLSFSRTDLADNPHPLAVAWAGPLFGAAAPLLVWLIAAAARLRGAFVLRFFAGFCLVVNGLYIGLGSFNYVGDCGEMLRHGSASWQLWLFGLATAPLGIWFWHGQGPYFGLGPANGRVDNVVAYATFAVFLALLLFAIVVGGG